MRKEKITVVMVEPNKNAQVATIQSDLTSMQRIVGGMIQAIYPFDDNVAIICNEEGKLLGLPFNRALSSDEIGVYDALVGTFFVVGCADMDFVSLSSEQIEKYKHRFLFPEKIAIVDGQPVVVRYASI